VKNNKKMQKFEGGTVERFHVLLESVRLGSREKFLSFTVFIFNLFIDHSVLLIGYGYAAGKLNQYWKIRFLNNK
jgi:hypothetical protein